MYEKYACALDMNPEPLTYRSIALPIVIHKPEKCFYLASYRGQSAPMATSTKTQQCYFEKIRLCRAAPVA